MPQQHTQWNNKYARELGDYFFRKKTSSDTSDLEPEVCQRRFVVLKRQRQCQTQKKKKLSLLSLAKNKLRSVRTVCTLCYFRTLWTHALTYCVRALASRTHNNFYIYRKWRVVVFCFPSSNTKTDEQILPCFYFPANRRHTKSLSFAAGKPLALCGHLPLVDLLRFAACKK